MARSVSGDKSAAWLQHLRTNLTQSDSWLLDTGPAQQALPKGEVGKLAEKVASRVRKDSPMGRAEKEWHLQSWP